jgi:hypothetical protein
MKPRTFQHISRAIDKHGVHHLDALDERGHHWYATMQQKEEPWLTIHSKMGIEDTLK